MTEQTFIKSWFTLAGLGHPYLNYKRLLYYLLMGDLRIAMDSSKLEAWRWMQKEEHLFLERAVIGYCNADRTGIV